MEGLPREGPLLTELTPSSKRLGLSTFGPCAPSSLHKTSDARTNKNYSQSALEILSKTACGSMENPYNTHNPQSANRKSLWTSFFEQAGHSPAPVTDRPDSRPRASYARENRWQGAAQPARSTADTKDNSLCLEYPVVTTTRHV